ncbi:hypothetical protein M3Y97_00188900 [Aphelenchoides bicaudatus]|nr:hypothetical protein M3Y97_00188900 [Aphelenchoides bicaudatus]
MTDYGGTARLPRYDASTLQPIRTRHPLLNDNGIDLSGYRSYSRRPIPLDLYTVPRVSQQWSRPLSPLAADPIPSAPLHDPNGTVRTLIKTPHLEPMPEETPPAVVTEIKNAAPVHKFDWEQRLFENYHIGIHRLVFLVRRFPALVALLTSIWILFGRKQTANFDLQQQEVNQNISLFTAALVSLIGIIFGVRNHGNLHKSALSQTISRLCSLFMSAVGEITTFVFGLIAIINLGKQDEKTPPDCYPKTCFSLNNRIVQSGVQLGLTLLSFILTAVAIFHGIRAIFQILYDRKVARRTHRRNRELAAYTNPVISKDIYF